MDYGAGCVGAIPLPPSKVVRKQQRGESHSSQYVVLGIESERAALVIDSLERADWLLKKLHQIDCEKALIKAQAEAMIAQLDADRASLERFLPQLREWGAQELEPRSANAAAVSRFARLPASPTKPPP